jgi:hypothetical protein
MTKISIVNKGISAAKRIIEMVSACFAILILLVVVYIEPRILDDQVIDDKHRK